MIAAPLLMLSLGVVTFAINGYAVNIAQDVAIEVAHRAALADVDLSVARQQANEDLKMALSAVFKASVVVEKVETESGCRTNAKVTMSTLTLGLLGMVAEIEEVASAVCERQE